MKKNTYETLQPIVYTLMKTLFHPTIEYLDEIPTDSKIILAGNHYSNFDPLLLSMVTNRQIHFLAKRELFSGILKPLMTSLECIPVNRDGNDLLCLKKSLEYLKDEKCLGIFPEGTTKGKTDDFILPFKLGTIVIAKKSKADIIPFGISGDYKLVKNNLRITIGKRIHTMEYNSKDLLEKLENDVKTLMLRK